MAEYIFKVQISLSGNNSECFYYRQVTDSTECNFDAFKRNLIERYGILKSVPFKVTWHDNVSDQISIVNETDYCIFMELKGTKVIIEDYNNSIAIKRKMPKNDKNPIAAERKRTETENDPIAAERKKPENEISFIPAERKNWSSFNATNKVNATIVQNQHKSQELVLHPHVYCDECNGKVRGYRYKCLICPDFDLCSSCEMNQIHSEHNMVRIVKQISRANLKNDLQKAKLITETQDQKKSSRRKSGSNKKPVSFGYGFEMSVPNSRYQPRMQASKPPTTYASQSNVLRNIRSLASHQKDQASTRQVETIVPVKKSVSSAADDLTQKSDVSSSSVSVSLASDSSDRVEGYQVDKSIEMGQIGVEKDNREILITQDHEDQIHFSPVKATTIDKCVSFVDEVVETPSTKAVLTSVDFSNHSAEEPNSKLVQKSLHCTPTSELLDDVMTLLENNEKNHTKLMTTETPAVLQMPSITCHHPDKKISSAISTMTAMGFSNDYGWLACLLENVDGDVIKALELLFPIT